MERIVLAYSGGLDTSVAVPWLAETYHADVITVTMDLGQGRELDSVRERALAAGAARAHVLGRQSPHRPHDRALATCDESDRSDHRAAEGFVRAWRLPVETVARRRKRVTASARSTEAA